MGGFHVTIIAVLILISSSINQVVFSQSVNDVFSSEDLTTRIKIIEPVKEQLIEIGNDLEIAGEASAAVSKECNVIVTVNNAKSSQNAIRVDLKGNQLVTQWKFVIHANYELFNEGQNTITAKLYCPNSELISAHSVMVIGNRPAQIESVGPINTSTNLDQAHNHEFGSKTNEFDIVAAGDYGCNPVTEITVNKMKEKNPDLFLALGDLSEDKDPACFFDLFSNVNKDGKLKVTLGEHDIDSVDNQDSSSRFSQFIRHLDLDKPFYSFDYRNAHFLAMSTGKDDLVPFGIGSAQYNFTVNDLAAASNNKEIKWIIVYGYRPFYSSPTVHPASETIKDFYHPLFQKYGVDLVITTHNHNYQRTYPLKLTGNDGSEPTITDKNNSTYINPGGPIFITVGTAGEELHDLAAQYPFVATQFKRNGFLDVHISNNGTRLTGIFFDSLSETDGDYFTIAKL
jgi:calcineurin-like phosphoesterase family protein